jgi:hypothetical protein
MYIDIRYNQHTSEFDRDLANVQISKELGIPLGHKFLFVVSIYARHGRSMNVVSIDESAPDGFWGTDPAMNQRNIKILSPELFIYEFCDIRDLSPTGKELLFTKTPLIGGTINSDTASYLADKYGRIKI